MFKSKWQRKYEKAMGNIEFWKKFHEEQMKTHTDCSYIYAIHSAQKVALNDILRDMKRIAEEP